MTVPTHAARIRLGVIDDNVFTVGDATNGRIDNSVSLLGDGTTTIATDVVAASVARGSSGQLGEAIDPGRVTLVFNNEDRKYDPSYTSGAYFGELVPGRDIIVLANGRRIFTGYVDDWDVDYDVIGRSTATCRGVDGLSMLAQSSFAAWTSTAGTADGKLGEALDRPEVDWDGGRSFDPGLEDLGDVVFDEAGDVLPFMQTVAESDLGALFADTDGVLTFRNRLTAYGASTVTFSDDGSDIEYVSVSAQVGSDILASTVVVTRDGGEPQTQQVDDLPAWKEAYGPARTATRSGLYVLNDGRSRSLASYLLDRYSEPTFQFRTVTVVLEDLSEVDQNTVLGLDIASVVTVEMTPNGVGSQIVEKCWVTGIDHDLSADSHRVTFKLVAAFPNGEEDNLWGIAVWDTGEWV